MSIRNLARAQGRLRARPPAMLDDTIHKIVRMAAPMGGLNTIDALSSMDPADCVALLNLIPADTGLRSRFGWKEWVTGLTGGAVRSVLFFRGSAKNGANDRVFACTPTGIWNVTASTQAPGAASITFPSSANEAGRGVAYNFVTPAGAHYLAYCDEQNGYYLYQQAIDAWQKVVSSTQPAWAAATAYVAGNLVTNGGNVYLCITGGTSAAPGPTGVGPGTTTDGGGVVWQFNFSVSGVDPAQFVNVLAWKNRLWFTARDSAQSWFLGLASIAGAATQFNFGSQFKSGGPLIGLWNWTVDGGQGIDNYLVAISGAGDVAVYQGTDPAGVGTFGLRGVWQVGAIPSGRSIATEYGGDVLIVSAVGAVPLTRLTQGNVVFDRSQYFTWKVANLVNQYVQLYGTNPGWQIRLHPNDNSLVVIVPNAPATAQPTTILAMQLARRSWSQYPDIPMTCAENVNGTLYFGTADGRVCQNTGFADGVLLANPNVSTPIQWSLLSSFQTLASPRKKRVHEIRPIILSQSPSPQYAVQARFDYDETAIATLPGVPPPTGNVWDSALWDSAIWQSDLALSQNVSGASGIGAAVAIAVRGSASVKTTLTAIDVVYEEGGFF